MEDYQVQKDTSAYTKTETVSRDTVYTQMYNEMRRFRDYEFTSSMWYTALLVAIVGFVSATRFAGRPEGIANLLESHCYLKTAVTVIAVFVAAASSYLIHFAYRRYTQLRTWTDNHIEPEWKMKTFTKETIPLTPRHIYYITQWVLVGLIVLFLFIPKA